MVYWSMKESIYQKEVFMKKKISKNNTGFSLVEIIIAIAILAVLIGIVAPQYLKYVEKSKRVTDVHNARDIRDAIERAAAIYGNDLVKTGHVIWNASTSSMPSGEPNSLLDAMFLEMGHIPVSSVNKRFFWGAEWYYQEKDSEGNWLDISERQKAGTVKRIYLCPPASLAPGSGPNPSIQYELWPDPSDFLENGLK